jgi:hypothetical protein
MPRAQKIQLQKYKTVHYYLQYAVVLINILLVTVALKKKMLKNDYSETSIHRSRYSRLPACIVCLIWSRN